jgi:hypothetical protein
MQVSDLGGDEPWAPLLDALSKVGRGEATARCAWYAEPGWHVLLFDRVESGLRVRVGRIADPEYGSHSESRVGEEGFEFDESEPLAAVIRAAASEARWVLERLGGSGYEEAWGAPFPTEQLRQLEALASGLADSETPNGGGLDSKTGVLTLEEIGEIEKRYVIRGEPSLGLARAALLRRWKARARDRESCLRLLFLIWDACSHPTFRGSSRGASPLRAR